MKRRTAAISSSSLGLAVVAGLHRVGHAMAHVAVEHLDGHVLERGLSGGDLREDVDAIGVLVDHALQPAHLALDAPQAVEDRLVVGLHGAS